MPSSLLTKQKPEACSRPLPAPACPTHPVPPMSRLLSASRRGCGGTVLCWSSWRDCAGTTPPSRQTTAVARASGSTECAPPPARPHPPAGSKAARRTPSLAKLESLLARSLLNAALGGGGEATKRLSCPRAAGTCTPCTPAWPRWCSTWTVQTRSWPKKCGSGTSALTGAYPAARMLRLLLAVQPAARSAARPAARPTCAS